MRIREWKIMSIILVMASQLSGQIKIGGNPIIIDNSAALELESTNKGFLIPRMTTSQRNLINSPANALLVFDTDFNSFLYFNGVDWIEISGIPTNKIGMISGFACPVLPNNWVALEGGVLSVANYPELASQYPGWVSGSVINLPDYRGYFLRGAGNNSNGVSANSVLGSKHGYSTSIANNAFTVTEAGSHLHSATINNSVSPGSAWNFHRHGVYCPSASQTHRTSDINSSKIAITVGRVDPPYSDYTSYGGNHAHSFSASSSNGSHEHQITGSADAETRPQNISLFWAVKVN